MARRNENTRQSRYVIHIICEGEKTEPLFFNSLRDRIIEGVYNIGDVEIIIVPKLHLPDANTSDEHSRGKYKGRKRTTNRSSVAGNSAEEQIITGVPPLKWVLYARKMLNEGSNEAWAVFDKDGHPEAKAAFDEASLVRNGKIVNIAFSSRSFEYYLLLHFEDYYWEFEATECGERINKKKKSFHCMLENATEKACLGDKCINGYARKKKYWEESKTSESMFPLVENRLLVAIVTAHFFRFISDNIDLRPIYERNPYTSVDQLICRLTNTIVINNNDICELDYNDDKFFMMMLPDNSLSIRNCSSRTVIIAEGVLFVFNRLKNDCTPLRGKIVLYPNDIYLLSCNLSTNESLIFYDKQKNKRYVFLQKYEVFVIEGPELDELIKDLKIK